MTAGRSTSLVVKHPGGTLGIVTDHDLRTRVLAEITTTFASHYTQTISLREAIQPDVIARYSRRATGEKFLLDPSK